jgi:hypothetical protein
MFHTRIDQITYEDVETFCKAFPEGVRVEYKQDPGRNIPRVVSSFANTVGGIWVIGVETDKATNLPKFPLVGMKRRAGVEEQIVQSAQTGIYPPITPDVKVLDVPGNPDQILAVVKVSESIEAPHAIEGSTRVYIRNASTTDPYELADMDRIEYFIKRREQPEKRREILIDRIAARSLWRNVAQRIRVVLAPVYPRGIVVPPDILLERAEGLEAAAGLPAHRLRLVHEGIFSSGADLGQSPEFHFEATVQGIVYYERHMEGNGSLPSVFQKTQTPYVHASRFVRIIAMTLSAALVLLRGSVTNILLRCELGAWDNVGMIVEDQPMRLVDPGGVAASRTLLAGQTVTVSTIAVLETLAERRLEVLTEVMQQLLWAFNYTKPDVRDRVEAVLHLWDRDRR